MEYMKWWKDGKNVLPTKETTSKATMSTSTPSLCEDNSLTVLRTLTQMLSDRRAIADWRMTPCFEVHF